MAVNNYHQQDMRALNCVKSKFVQLVHNSVNIEIELREFLTKVKCLHISQLYDEIKKCAVMQV